MFSVRSEDYGLTLEAPDVLICVAVCLVLCVSQVKYLTT